MSNSVSSGYYVGKAEEAKKTKCSKSPNKQHKWLWFGGWPSEWAECKYCKACIYTK